MFVKSYRKELKHLGTVAAVVLAALSPLTLTPANAAAWSSCASGISNTSNAVTTDSTSSSCIIKFTGANTWTVPDGVTQVAVAIVGGGGGGGYGSIGGGGGGGEVMFNPALTVTPTAAMTVGIGAGGANGFNAGTWRGGGRGGTSQFGTTYAGGGFGGAGNSTTENTQPTSIYGGSGGGSNTGNVTQAAVKQNVANWTSYAFAGGASTAGGSGGGGAGAVGAAGSAGKGGNGQTLPSPLGAYTVAGGGGGWVSGAGGTGGGGTGSGTDTTVANGTNGTANSGGGGGAAMTGGTGVVYLQYYMATVTYNANGGSGTMATGRVPTNGLLTANAFNRTGYTFKGWATSASGQVSYQDQAAVSLTADTTLYAVWAGNTDQTADLNATGSSDQWSSTAQVVPATGAFTVEAWVNPRSLQASSTIVSAGSGSNRFYFKVNTSGQLIIWREGSASEILATQASIPLNTWSHVAVALDGSTVTFYINGQPEGSASYAGGSTAIATGLNIGQYGSLPTGASTAWYGKIDQVKIWGSALTSTNIRSSMNAFADYSTSGTQIANTLRGAWGFNEGNGVTAYDATNNYTLTANGNAGNAADFSSVATVDAVKGIYNFPRSYLTSLGGFQIPAGAAYDWLVVAGGGSGGDRAGGGGGAGGYLSSVGTPASRISFSSGSIVRVLVGVGGIGYNTMRHGVSGTNSTLASVAGTTFTTQDAVGGGGGGTGNGAVTCDANAYAGYSGGSGGGSDGDTNCVTSGYAAGLQNPGSGTAGQGNAGGRGSNGSAAGNWTGGGGGGAGSVGGAGSSSGVAGNGGAGVNNGITGSKVCYAAGGGGGAYVGYTAGFGGTCAGTSSTGGTGSSGDTRASDALANTGSGGGGSGFNSLNGTPGTGGSGIVVLRASVSSITQPVFDAPVITGSGTGFTVNVSNYDPYYTYTATSTVGSATIGALNGSSLPITVSGLTAGQDFTVTVTATDGSLSSSASLSPPSTPTSVAIRAGDSKATISFTQATTTLRPVTGYQYTLNGGTSWTNATQTASPITITGLTNGTSYSIAIRPAGAGYGAATATSTSLSGLIWDVWAKDYNAGTGLWTDSSANATNVTATGTVPTASTYPSAVNFTGSTVFTNPNNYAAATDVTKYTVGAWFKTTSTGKIIGFGESAGYDRHIYVGTDGKLYAGVCVAGTCSTVVSSAPVNDGIWRYAVHTYDGTTLKLYINGVLQSSLSKSGALVVYTNGWKIGGTTVASWTAAPASGYFTGSIGHAFAYHRDLSAAEILTAYNAEAAPYSTITATFLAGSGSGTPPTAMNQTPNSSFTLPNGTGLTLAGNAVIGWTDGITSYNVGDTYTMGSTSVTLSPRWAGSNLSLTYNFNDSTTAARTVTYLTNGIITLTSATRPGSVLKGWSTDLGGNNIVGTSGGNYAPVTTTSLRLRYEFDDSTSYPGSGTLVNDISGYGTALNGTIYNGSTYAPSAPGSLTLNASSAGTSYINTPDISSKIGNTTVSMFAWIYATGNGVVVDELGNPSYHYSTIEIVSGKLYVRVWNGASLSSSATILNGWHQVGLTYDGSTTTGYLDGVSIGSVAMTRSPWSSGGYYALGYADGTNMGDGTYGEFKLGSFLVYNAGLTSTTVVNNYLASCARFSMAACNGQTLYAQWLAAAATPSATALTAATKSVSQSVTFTTTGATTDAGTLSYQWFKDGTAISGATSASYNIASIATTDAGSYSVRVTNTLYSGQTYQSTASVTTSAVALSVGAAPTITTPTGSGLNGTYNSAFTLNLTTTVSTSGRTFALASGTLPAGLTMDTRTGVISGTPSAAGTSTISVRVTDDNGATATTASFGIVIAKITQVITFTTVSARAINPGTFALSPSVNSSLTVTLASTTPLVCTVATGTFNVTAVAPGTCTLTASQTGDSNNTAATAVTQSFTISSVTVTFNSNYGTPATTTQTISAPGSVALAANPWTRTGYTFGGWATVADGSGTTYTNSQSVTLSASVTLYAQWTANTVTVTYNYNGATGGNSSATDSFTTGGSALTLPAPTKAGYVFAGWFSDNTTFANAVSSPYSPTAAITIYAKWLAAAVTPSATALTAANKTSGQSVTFTTTGSTTDAGTLSYQWMKNGTDIAGATSASYTIGSVAVGDAATYSVRVTNTLYSGQTWQSQASVTTSAVALTVAAAPTITTPTAGLTGTYNSAFSLSITASSGTAGKTFSAIGTLPTGLSIDSATGTISGTATAAGTFTLQVRITDANSATATTVAFSIVIAKASQAITFGALANKTLGTGTFTVSATASSGNTVSFTPANTSICTVSGTTVTLVSAGTCSIRADQAGDANWLAATQVSQTFTIATSLVITTPSTGLTGTYNSAYALNLSSSGGAGSNTWSLVNGTLPTGLTLDPATGIISGTPTAAGSQTISVRVTDANSATATTSSFVIAIAKASQTITFGAISARNVNAGAFTLTPSASSGLSVTLQSTTTGICTVSGLTITILTSGICSLTVSQAGDANFAAATSVTQTVTINPISVTFNSNFGTATTSTQSITAAGNVALTANGFNRAGYTFAGWTTAADGTGTSYTNGQSLTLTADTTLYAQWTATNQTVTYLLNGGTGSAPTQASTATTGTFTVAAGTGLSKTGYTFGGWNDGTQTYQPNDTYTMGASNVSLTAVWTANTYVVTYTYNSATGGYSTASSSFTTGGTAITLPTPTRTGYTFAGWYDDAIFSNLIGNAGASYSPTGTITAITIYAKWAVSANSIFYSANGGTGATTSTMGNTLTTVTIGNGTGISRGGYTLIGWNTAADLTGTEYLIGGTLVMPAGGVTLYADWNANSYTVSYNTEGGSSVAAGSYNTAGSITLPSAPTYAGYTFAGWFTAASGGSALAATYSPSGYGAITIYAQWSANAQTVSYDANNGNGTIALVSTNTGASVSLSSGTVMTRTGYTLAKWNTAANGSGTDYALSATATIPAIGLTLYAIWSPINYGISYNANSATSGSVPTDATNYNIGQQVTVLANSGNLARTGYTFLGWNTAADGSGTDYASSNRITVGSASITLYAKWSANTYTITYSVNGATGSATRSGVNVTSDTYTTASVTVTLPDVGSMAKRGYNFAGWATTPSGSAISAGTAAAYTTTSNITLYALWTIKNVAVHYSAGTMAGASFISFPADTSGNFATTITVGAGIDSSVTVTGPTRYDFMGWSDGSSVYQAGASYTLGETSVTFTALWVPVYAVRYIFNGGTPAANESALDSECAGTDGTCVNLTAITTNNTPTRAGYNFTGWVDQSNLAVAAGASYTVTDGHYLLYAQWAAINYKVNYASNGGSTAPSQADQHIGGVFNVGSAVTKTGYSFAGWDDGSQVYGVGASYTVATTDVTLSARWTPDVYSVNYDWNGGHGSTVSTDSFTVGTGSVTLPLVTDHVKDGYNFNGWSTSANGSLLGSTFTPTANTTLYAIWGAGSYTLSMNANGGAVANSSYSVANGTAQSLPDSTRSHFHFDGWYTSQVGGTRIGGNGDSYTPTGSGTLYAHWTQDSLFGMGAATRIGNLTTTTGIATGLTAYGPNNSANVYIPADSLPNGTSLDVYLLADTSRAASIIGGNKSYVVNLVVSWLAGDGTVPTTAASKSIRVTITDPNIKAGAAVYSLIGSTATYVGTATVDGSATVYISDDPELVVVATVPTAPLSATATPLDGAATVTWTAPSSTGGSPITSYLVTASNGNTCVTGAGVTTCDIHGLTNGTAYTFTVQALNSVGTSQASASTSAVTPMAVQAITFATPANHTLGSGTFSLAAVASSGLTVSFASTNTAICTVSGSTVTMVSAGTCTITADQAGNSSTLAAAQVSNSFTIASALSISTPTAGLTGSYNSAFSLSLNSAGGAGSNTYAISAGSLPAGLSLNSATGVISGTPTISGSSAVTVSVTDANGATTSTSNFTLVMSTIAQAALTVTTTTGTYGNGVSLAVSGGTTNGTVSYATSAGLVTCTLTNGVLTASGAGNCNVTATMAGDSYYSAVDSASTQVTFAKASQAALSVTSLAGTYGSGLTLQTSGGSGGGSVSYAIGAGTTTCSVSSGVLTAAAAGTCTVTATKDTDANYNAITSATVTVVFATANQAALTLSSTTGTFGSALSLATSGGSGTGAVTYSVSNGSVTCTLSNGSLTASGAGTCSVTATKATDGNYNAVNSSATQVTFAAASQSALTVSSTSGVFGTDLTLTYAGGSGTGAVTYSVANGSATCTLSNGVLTVTAAGTCSVTATRASDANYLAASSTSTTVTFSHAPQTISFGGLSNQTLGGGAAANVASATASSSLTVTFSSLTPTVCSISAGSVSLIASGTCTIAADQAGDAGYAAATRVSQSFAVAPALTITTPVSGLAGSYNSSFTLNLVAAGGAGSHTFAISAGSLPAGLSLNTSTGVITGVPSVSGTGTVTIQVSDANGAISSTSSFSIVINTIAQAALNLTSTAGTFGSTLTLAVSGGSNSGAVSYSVAAGSTTCTLSNGTLTAAGAGTCIVTATMAGDAYYDAAVTSATTVAFSKAAQAALSLTSVAGTYGTALTLVVTGGNGTGTISYTVVAGSTTCTLSNGTLTAAGAGSCTVTATKDTDSNYTAISSNATTVTFGVAGQSPVLVTTTAGTYGTGITLAASGGSGTGAYTFTVADGTATCVITNGDLTAASAGTCLVTASRAADTNHSSASSAATTVTFAHATQTVTFGSLVNRTIGGSQSPITVSASASSTLAVTFTSLTGLVCSVANGTVTLIGAGTCTIAADQTGDARFASATRVSQSFAVSAALQLATPSSGLSGTVGSAYSLLLADNGGAGSHVFVLLTGTLPLGLLLDPATGLISGTPTAVGASSISVRVTDANGATADTAVFSIGVVAAPVVVVPPAPQAAPLLISLPSASLSTKIRSVFSAATTAQGGTAPYAFSFSGSLPKGLTFDSVTGILSGTVAQAGAFNLIITVTDARGATTSSPVFALLVAKAPQDPLQIHAPAGTAGKSVPVTVTGGSGLGSLSLNLAGGSASGCSLSGNSVSADTAGSCLLVANSAGDDSFEPATASASVDFLAVTAPDVSTWSIPTESIRSVIDGDSASGTGSGSTTGSVSTDVRPVLVKDGVIAAVTTLVTPDQTGLTIASPEWTITLKASSGVGTGANGAVDSSVSGSQLVVASGSSVTVSGEKFQANSLVQIWVYSTPILLGTVEVRPDGSFASAIPLPKGLELGNHTLVLQGLNANLTVQTVQAPMIVKPAATNGGGSGSGTGTDGGSGSGSGSGTGSTTSVRIRFASTGAHVTPRIQQTVGRFAKALGKPKVVKLNAVTYFNGPTSKGKAKFLCALRAQRVQKLLQRSGVRASISCSIAIGGKLPIPSQVFDLSKQ